MWFSFLSRFVVVFALVASTTVFFLKKKKFGNRTLPVVSKFYIPDAISNVIEPIRTSGLLERWYTANHNTGIYCCVGFAAQLEGKIPSRDQMLYSMEELIRKYPHLRTATLDTDNNPTKGPSYLFWINQIDLRSALKMDNRIDSNTWTQVFLREQHLSFTRDFDALDKTAVDQHGLVPFFKFVLVAPQADSGPFEIIFGVHHAIADGMAGICLFRDFLEILGNAISANAVPTGLPSQLDSRVLESQPLELLLDIRPSVWDLLHVLLTEVFPVYERKREDWLGPPQLDTYHRTSNVVLLQIPKTQTDSLLQACRSQKVTINATLFAASHFAVAKLLKGFPSLSSHSACNLRPFCDPKPPPNAMGSFVCGPEAIYKMEPQMEFWDFARKAKQYHSSTTQQYYQKIGMLGFLSSLHSYFEKKKVSEPNARVATMSLSNLGSIPFPDRFANFSMKSCYFSNVKFGEGAVFMESVVTVQGNLHLVISYVEQLTSREDMQTQFWSFTPYAIMKREMVLV